MWITSEDGNIDVQVSKVMVILCIPLGGQWQLKADCNVDTYLLASFDNEQSCKSAKSLLRHKIVLEPGTVHIDMKQIADEARVGNS